MANQISNDGRVIIEYEADTNKRLDIQLSYLFETTPWKNLKKYGYLLFVLIVFSCIIPTTIGIHNIGESEGVVNFVIKLLIALLLGGVMYYIFYNSQIRAINKAVFAVPNEMNGKYIIELDIDSIRIKTPMSQSQYDWKLVTNKFETSKYIFCVCGYQLLFAIPIEGLNEKDKITAAIQRSAKY